ncbi:MAG: alanyl-tRNA editing protein [Candidatus Lokiarchaeota archaeon]|nr:alanyl-tRNA editing protein [Candidatus Lokiarchaeota archaeon]
MARALYMDDSYLKNWTAKVKGVKDGKYVILDNTAFYPKGGGQPWDEGVITKGNEKFRVVYVGKFSGNISHEIDKPGLQEGDEISCEIDWKRRYTFMRYHTASHLISNILYNRANAKITGNQIEMDKTRMDFSMVDYSPEKLGTYVDETNSIIEQDLPITLDYMDRQDVLKKPELARLAVGLPENIKEFRIVKIGDIDKQVDGGTHVKHLSEIGKIEVIKTVNKGKNNRRLYFILKNI